MMSHSGVLGVDGFQVSMPGKQDDGSSLVVVGVVVSIVS